MEFDYIIVGAGSAGCVLAERLSANPRVTVLVIEAGGSDARFFIRMPLGYGFTFADPAVNWCYHAKPDAGLDGRVAYWPRGRVLGGSSSINAMAYVRGLPHDFDDWGRAGAAGWSWDSVRPIYERLECHQETGADGRPRLRGKGPVHVSDLGPQMHPFSRRFIAAAAELGWPVVDDVNGMEMEGISRYRSTVRGGRRWSAADAFLLPARARANLTVVCHALVERLEITDRQATGVIYRAGGRSVTARARLEVIVSAGAVNSPQLLQLSGLGPAEHLRRHGVTPLLDLPQVGEGLQDHLAVTHHFAATEPTLNSDLGPLHRRILAGLRYVLTRSGPLTVPVNQVGGFVRSTADQAVPDVQIYCNPASYGSDAAGRTILRPEPSFILSAQPCRPTSRGSIRITSPDPSAVPAIQPNSLATSEDRDAAIRASRLVQRLARTPTIRDVTRQAKEPDISAMDDVALLANFRARAATVFHPTCTCRMGRDATDSVVDGRLRVHGVGGLRVVDASAFPNITSGNTNAPTLMLAMRAADMILEDAAARS